MVKKKILVRCRRTRERKGLREEKKPAERREERVGGIMKGNMTGWVLEGNYKYIRLSFFKF